jgi:hypothetical protein
MGKKVERHESRERKLGNKMLSLGNWQKQKTNDAWRRKRTAKAKAKAKRRLQQGGKIQIRTRNNQVCTFLPSHLPLPS